MATQLEPHLHADEDAFRAVQKVGGIAVKVADGPVARSATAAAWSIDQPHVAALLESFLPPAGKVGS